MGPRGGDDEPAPAVKRARCSSGEYLLAQVGRFQRQYFPDRQLRRHGAFGAASEAEDARRHGHGSRPGCRVSFPSGRPEAILFDWDSTLVDNWDSNTAVINVVLADLDCPLVTRERMIELSKQPLNKIFPLLFGSQAETGKSRFYELFPQQHLQGLKILPGTETLLVYLCRVGHPAWYRQ